MDYTAFCIVLGILFWVLAAAAVVLLGAWLYIQAMYYHWNKKDREQDDIISQVQQAVNDQLANIDSE